ncbi:hypothetical protein ACH95_09950 [Bacillus glycinifermentans]|uniref:Uncharacterized protein n=1 Tax=Bacillus glycinifermentans TaxID=1664069 RepID=A0A0J6ER30_9BACI|nr:hypothetical protein [Bacillus glycinifermentans]KMM60008.1 hypothetical protein ACH95_09950 [Bacillus glycinifermentans]KRT92720.1 hypothetical protein AB447_222330 [Bacillus glycinifermentans]MEC0483408.1 hypothetical protein [Bacillus glycinifermentans]MEC0497361.1 hypothetical protein [Bacillus glycinifermentans]MEC0543464.1 hypothetical protein [Bacillus glycinifermentans]
MVKNLKAELERFNVTLKDQDNSVLCQMELNIRNQDETMTKIRELTELYMKSIEGVTAITETVHCLNSGLEIEETVTKI